jgi:hypothetical protein
LDYKRRTDLLDSIEKLIEMNLKKGANNAKVNGGQIFILDKSPPWERFYSIPPSIDNRLEN